MRLSVSKQIKTIVKNSLMGPLAWELYFSTRFLKRMWTNSVGPYLAASTAHTLNLKYNITLPITKQWEEVLNNSKLLSRNLPKASGPRVLFATVYGFGGAGLDIESILAKSLQLRGVQVMSLACDKSLPACDWNRCGNHNPSPDIYGPRMFARTRLNECRICTDAVLDLYKQIGVPQVLLSNFMREDDLERITQIVDAQPYKRYDEFVYKDIKVGEHARSSVLRSLLRGILQDDAYTRWLYRRYMLSAMLLTDLTERVFAAVHPECVVECHGVYVTHGTIAEIARKHGIPVVVYGIPYRKGTVWLSHNDTYHRTLVKEPTSQWEHLSLTPEQERTLGSYLGSRLSGGRDYVTYHPNPIEDKEIIMQDLGLDSVRPIISLFTNVLYDAQIFYSYNAFDGMLDWLFQTIKHFAHRSDIQLVVRIHPAEVKGGFVTNQPIVGEIDAQFPVLPENVKVIPPESDLSSYTLAEMSRAALIYGTKMGLEIAIRGVPVIVAGETLNRGKGYTYDVESKEQYFSLLDRILDLPRNSPVMIDRARKYAYHLFFRRMIDFPLLEITDTDPIATRNARLKFRHLAELLPGSCPNLDTICEGILNRTPFVVD